MNMDVALLLTVELKSCLGFSNALLSVELPLFSFIHLIKGRVAQDGYKGPAHRPRREVE
jgi:hypothetical protein